ncbi:MAG TPA: methyltransferase domain-containing protein [Polyangia bacterium]|jgi:SAM-dependent methyltransferase|nr:methyltransferase domain-containing protein [Polyangia bacterium]
MKTDGYEEAQARGAADAYARYLAGMDASMRQKVALTAAHLLCEGRVADMGMGSGQGSHALAALYPRLDVVGVDIDPTMVALAGDRYRLANLSFVAGDIARPVFPDGSLDGIFDSSVLHHVTSYGGYRHANAAEALRAQVAELKPHGVLIVRDFLDPGPGTVLLDVPADDGDASDDPARCSTASLLERFAREFRSLHAQPGFDLEAREAPGPGWRRYRLSHKHAAEFVLRKDYRQDWVSEVKEEYTYFSQPQFEELFASFGLRVLFSSPLNNPWIVRHRFRGRFRLHAEDGRPIEWPATNYIIVGEKVAAGEGVGFRAAAAREPRGFLRLEHHRHRATGRVFDLAARAHTTIDIIPFFQLGGALELGGAVYVLARTSYPRPIACAAPALDGSRTGGYLAEPLSVVQGDRPIGQTVEETLPPTTGITPDKIRRMLAGTTYYPSPGGIMEEVRSMFVEVDPLFTTTPLGAVSGFSTSGRVRAIETCQLLRAAQVGGIPDARLELNVYDLLLRLRRPLGPWIGEAIRVDAPAEGIAPAPVNEAFARAGRRAFDRTAEPAGFLALERTRYQEVDGGGRVLGERELEHVAPVPFGTNTVAVALLAASGGEVLIGVDEEDFPAAQGFGGNSNLLVTPAWRLPREIATATAARAWIEARARDTYGLVTGEAWDLGGPYRPSPGLTAEVVFPLALEVRARTTGSGSALRWLPIAGLVERRAELPDGHLRIVLLRAAHALGIAVDR